MEQRVVLYVILMNAAWLTWAALRSRDRMNRPQTIQYGIVLALAVLSLATPQETALFWATVIAGILLVFLPVQLFVIISENRRLTPIAALILPYFWWGRNGEALGEIGVARTFLAQGRIDDAERIIAKWISVPLSHMVRIQLGILIVYSAYIRRDWRSVLERAAPLLAIRDVQIAAARALAELQNPEQAILLLQNTLEKPLPRHLELPWRAAELSVFAAAGDLERINLTAADDGVRCQLLPRGALNYWRGRALLATGNVADAAPYLKMAEQETSEQDPAAAVAVRTVMDEAEEYRRSPVTDGYSVAAHAYIGRRREMAPWLNMFSAGIRTPTISAIVTVVVGIAIVVSLLNLSPGSPELAPYLNVGLWTVGQNQYYRLFTAMFLHSGALHVLLNATVLWMFGRPAERVWGSAGVALVYLASGMGGHLISALWHENAASIGASTGVYGVVALFALTFVRYRTTGLDAFRNRTLRFLGILIILDIALSLTEEQIDTAGHVGGLLVGLALGLLLNRHKHPKP
ncbi:MAG: rhomboid family intramembrane serine protease [Myxococcales bacterium]|nr:rhomboid family intramembrane serine protease [Myxococcales bacterium]